MGPCPRPPLPRKSSRAQRLFFLLGLAGSGHMGAGIARVQSPPLGRIARPDERREPGPLGGEFLCGSWPRRAIFLGAAGEQRRRSTSYLRSARPLGPSCVSSACPDFSLDCQGKTDAQGGLNLGGSRKLLSQEYLLEPRAGCPEGTPVATCGKLGGTTKAQYSSGIDGTLPKLVLLGPSRDW